MPIKSFRAKIAHNTQQTVSLHTNDGSIGYRIKKLEVISSLPATQTQESVIKVFKIDGKTIDETIDFSDNTLLAAAYFEGHSNSTNFGGRVIIFDNEVFNQDIYVVHRSEGTAQPVNYYIELEQVKLDLQENTVATLKDIRNIEASY